VAGLVPEEEATMSGEQPQTSKRYVGDGLPFCYDEKGTTRGRHFLAGIGYIVLGAIIAIVSGLLIYWMLEGGGCIVFVLFLGPLIGIGLVLFGLYTLIESVVRSTVMLRCCYCGDTRRLLTSVKLVRCPECFRMLWMPRSQRERVVRAVCPVCRVENGLPGGGGKPTACPNCHVLLLVGLDGSVSLGEPTVACPHCGGQRGATCWYCPSCSRILKPGAVPEPSALDGKAFANAVAPIGALLASDCTWQRVLQSMKGADLSGAETGDYAERVKDLDRLGWASFCLLRACAEPSYGQAVAERLTQIDRLYGLLLFRTYCAVGAPAQKPTKAAKDESFLNSLNGSLTQFATTRVACQDAMGAGGAGDVQQSRWYVQAPLGEEGFGKWAGKMLVANIAAAAVGMHVYGKRAKVLADPAPLLHKAAEVTGMATPGTEPMPDDQLVMALRADYTNVVRV
jgi:hypothetical protein